MKSFPNNKLKSLKAKEKIYNDERCFENDSITFKPEILSALIKNSIGHDYYYHYKKYLDNLFEKCERNNYYIQISKETDYKKIINLLHDKLIDMKNIYKLSINDNSRFIKNCLKLKSLNDVEFIISLLYKLEKISKDSPNLKSFKDFLKDLKHNIINVSYRSLPKSIINFSVFKFCISGYPYETKSGKVYSISNIEETYNKIDIYIKNSEALIDFIEDILILNSDDLNFELNILKISYGISIALIALSAEEDVYENIIRNHIE